MDDTKSDQRLTELKQALRNIDETPSDSKLPQLSGLEGLFANTALNQQSIDALTTLSLSSITSSQIQTLDLSNSASWGSITSISLGGSGGGGSGGGYHYQNTVPNVTTGTGIWTETVLRGSRVDLQGANADLTINGQSMVELLNEINDRLAILKPDKDMEQDWQELRDLRQQYEQKLEHCRQKSRTWAALKK